MAHDFRKSVISNYNNTIFFKRVVIHIAYLVKALLLVGISLIWMQIYSRTTNSLFVSRTKIKKKFLFPNNFNKE